MLCIVACLGVTLLAVSHNRPVAAPGCEIKSTGRMIEQEFESSKSSVEINMLK